MVGYRGDEPALARNYVNDGCDFLGRKISEGDTVVKLLGNGLSTLMEIRKVGKVSPDGTVYLITKNGRFSRMHFSGRLVIIDDNQKD